MSLSRFAGQGQSVPRSQPARGATRIRRESATSPHTCRSRPWSSWDRDRPSTLLTSYGTHRRLLGARATLLAALFSRTRPHSILISRIITHAPPQMNSNNSSINRRLAAAVIKAMPAGAAEYFFRLRGSQVKVAQVISCHVGAGVKPPTEGGPREVFSTS
ncbi:hypothetical protein BV20DRAFT_469770 [Pilatotrama ljubarskyi]|nr:hypothetical protein BV20DRAFT_469770 [Pilatotrama ljubarskyi]